MRSKMTSVILSIGFLTALATWWMAPIRVDAQDRPTAQSRPATKPTQGRPQMGDRPPREVTMAGRVVSVHAFMTGQSESPDQAKSTTDNIRAGLPVALDSPAGLILLGQGGTSVARVLTPFALQEVEVHGKLYEKGAMKYIDIASVEAVQAEEEEEEEEEEGE